MKIYNKSHEQALKLKREMDSIEKQHELHIRFQEQNEKTKSYLMNKKANDDAFLKREKVFEAQEDEAYEKYYRHMHKNFDIKNSPIDYTNRKKYKDGFADEKYINDLYKHQQKTTKRKK